MTWISGLVMPHSVLTAVMQVAARKNRAKGASWELDKLGIVTVVQKDTAGGDEDDTNVRAPAAGVLISGLSMQGARWAEDDGGVSPSRPKQMFCDMPLVLCQARPRDSTPVTRRARPGG